MVVNNTLTNSSLTTIAFEYHCKFSGGDAIPLRDLFVIVGNYTWDGLTPSSPDEPTSGPYAAECILDFCVKEYAANSNNGSFHETPIGDPAPLDAATNRDVDVGPASLAYYDLMQDGKNYTIGENAMKGFWFYFTTLFTDSVAQYNSASMLPERPSDLIQSTFQHLNATPHTLDSMFNDIASAATLNIRTDPVTETVPGDAFYQQPIVTVRWVWMALPLALLVLVLIFLATVAVQTRIAGMETWKTSSVAALFALQGLREKKEMDAVAKRMYMRLGLDGRGQWVLQQRA